LGKGVYEFNMAGHMLKKAGGCKGGTDKKYKNKMYFPIF
jgi:hypothetical protein